MAINRIMSQGQGVFNFVCNEKLNLHPRFITDVSFYKCMLPCVTKHACTEEVMIRSIKNHEFIHHKK